MKGDVILVEEHHYRVARIIVGKLLPAIQAKQNRYTITVGGESGSGKSETAKAIAETLEARGIPTGIFQQDDYFVHPPKTNDATRRQDISWVGTQEVKIDLLDEHLQAFRAGADAVTKPLVIYDEDRVTEETMSLKGLQVIVAEGTYTTLLQNVDTHVFIARNRLDTLAHRQKRGREKIEPFIEEVLKIEHAIISQHHALAEVIITRDYEVEVP